ncbi:hypothetical protein D1006_28350 [Burkholderia stabilis]|uniref:Uncharacterized protein n=1 Tax=Burkholderia stabilis TaxID=95485 RepID=A0A4Q2AGI1_9BURK|nr:hypothetical protein D1006_28350 [Burkholderia stabilis]
MGDVSASVKPRGVRDSGSGIVPTLVLLALLVFAGPFFTVRRGRDRTCDGRPRRSAPRLPRSHTHRHSSLLRRSRRKKTADGLRVVRREAVGLQRKSSSAGGTHQTMRAISIRYWQSPTRLPRHVHASVYAPACACCPRNCPFRS